MSWLNTNDDIDGKDRKTMADGSMKRCDRRGNAYDRIWKDLVEEGMLVI